MTTTSPRFELLVTITGTLAAQAVAALNPLSQPPIPVERVPIVYEQDIPIPRLWHNRQYNTWDPSPFGTSIFDPAWCLDQVREWCRRYASANKGVGRVIIDIENIHPFLASMKDSRANLDQMRKDLVRYRGVTRPADQDDIIAFGLRQLWTTLMDDLEERGVDASYYGHTPVSDEPAGIALRDGRCWFDARAKRTHPVIYEWLQNRSWVEHANQVIRPRIHAARRLSPLAPCYPFVTDLLDDANSSPTATRIQAEKFDSMVGVSKEEGAAGIVLWRHVNSTKDLTSWFGAVDRIVRPALAKHFIAVPAQQQSPV